MDISNQQSDICGKNFNHAEPSPSNDSFTSTNGELLVGEQKYIVRILNMIGSTMIFISNAVPECVDEIGVAMPMQNGKILVTTILGQAGAYAQTLAEKLSKRYGRMIYVSFNVQIDSMNASILEQQISDFVHNNIQELK